ncbi:DUF697 domain-containing protein [candidate division KSB1 bacterium]|nr:DUF697 domain-containing protein [candidate division KSB1 bacterium]
MKLIKRFLFFISLFFLYLILKEFLILYFYIRALHPYAGYVFLILLVGAMIYFIIIPILGVIRIRRLDAPVRDPEKVNALIRKRLDHLAKNTYLRKSGFKWHDITPDRDGYDRVIQWLEPEAERIRKKYVTQVFYGTAIAQNGFLDAVIILSSSVHLIRDLFLLYQGRTSNRDLFSIARMVYYSMAVGGSEGIEYATDEIVSRLFSGGMKGIPFASKILGSIADGFLNAALLTRVSLITDNYCKMLFIESERALYPSYKTVFSTTRILTSDLIERLVDEVKKLAKDKTGQMVVMTVNPVGYVMGKALDRLADNSEKLSENQKEWIRETSHMAHNPVGYTFRKISDLFRKKKSWDDVIPE